jgi:hypothetical protein
LEEEVKNEFRAKADEIAEEKVSEIDQVIVEDRNAGMGAEDVRKFNLLFDHEHFLRALNS